MAAPSDINEIWLSSSPHFSAGRSTKGVMLTVILSLLPICICGICNFGLNAFLTILISVTTCVASEFVFQKLTKQTIRVGDCSAIVTGLLLALVLPSTVPYWMTMLGAIFAIVVAKGFFGGIGANVFNPALTGRAFMTVSFPAVFGSYALPKNGEPLLHAVSSATAKVDAVSHATGLALVKNGELAPNSEIYRMFFLGNRSGCIGETCILALVLVFAFLVITKIIDWRAPLAMICTVALGTFLTGGDVLFAILSGGLIFGAVFMVTDYATTPVTKYGRYIFGFGCGLITFLIRKFGGYPEGVMFSILIMNAVVPFLNKIIPHKYGWVKKAKKQGNAK